MAVKSRTKLDIEEHIVMILYNTAVTMRTGGRCMTVAAIRNTMTHLQEQEDGRANNALMD